MRKVKGKKVYVAMSGGVDSSVAALLLRDEGYDVTGVFMRCYNVDGCSERDAADARRVAAHLGIPFYVFDFEEEYKKRVVDYMIDGYRRGITPNPDVMCNKEIKFGLFLEKALSLGADYVATGHYVKVGLQPTTYKLFAARDASKDQSYFLWTLTQEQLKHCLFPIGDYLKSEVREMARKADLPTAEKKDSQGICFLGKVALANFLKNYIPEERGAVFTTAGKKIGDHSGAHFYTIGQRHIGVSSSSPVYVAEKDMATNTVLVAEESDPALYRKEIQLADLNFINPDSVGTIRANGSIGVLARMRYRQPLAPAALDGTRLVFDSPQKFVAPGQSAVFYLPAKASAKEGSKAGELLGGGVII